MGKYNSFSMQSLFKPKKILIKTEMQSWQNAHTMTTVDFAAITIITFFRLLLMLKLAFWQKEY